VKVDSSDYGRRIKSLRESAGLTQAQLAEILGFRTPYYISQLETGKRDPGLSVLIKICRALEIELSEFFKKGRPKSRSYRQSAINDLLEGVSMEKQKLIEEYIVTVKDLEPEEIRTTLLSAQKERLWREYFQKRVNIKGTVK
jgi:transcriptional regulator with XRE-family HTH domain